MQNDDLDDKKKIVLNQIIDSYLIDGAPVGSKTLSKKSKKMASSSSLRNIMSQLEFMGLIYSPHVSSGRLPTEKGLRMYVDNLLAFQTINNENDNLILNDLNYAGQRGPKELLSEASASLSGMSSHAGIVVVPKTEKDLKHIEFVRLSKEKALVVLIDSIGSVENRIITIDEGTPDMTFEMAGNYLNSKINGQSIDELRTKINSDIKKRKNEIDALAAGLISKGLAIWANDHADSSLIIHGHDKLLDDEQAIEDLEKIKSLFSTLGNQELSIQLLEDIANASGVKIFIGSENRLF
jgi:heat shock gene repressor HrcA